MLSHLVIARSALGHRAPDMTSHAAMNCMFSRLFNSLSDLAGKLSAKD